MKEKKSDVTTTLDNYRTYAVTVAWTDVTFTGTTMGTITVVSGEDEDRDDNKDRKC